MKREIIHDNCSILVNRIYLLMISFLCVASVLSAQSNENIKENVFLHLSHSVLITGETLYYSASVVSDQTNKLSPLSELLYVELIDENGEPVHQAKVRIKDGKGYGDIFLTSLISTGSYQLIAYTRWMRNFNQFYHHPIQIINPFENYEIPETTEKLEVKFYPEGGHLVIGNKNRMVVEITDHNRKGTKINGRLVDDEGTVVSQVQSATLGLADIEFTPASGRKYQLIIEDKTGNFQFINLPLPETEKFSIQVNERGGSLQISVLGQDEQTVTIKAYHGTNELLLQETFSGNDLLIDKQDLKPGVNLFVALINGLPVSNRLVYIYPDQAPVVKDGETSYGTRSYVSMPLNLTKGSNVSVSVRKFSKSLDHLGLHAANLLDGVNELYLFEESLVFDQSNRDHMDMLMLKCTWKYEVSEVPSIELLPDHRGEIISGKLNLPDSVEYKNQLIAYSLIGKDYQVKMTDVDEKGNFSMIITSFEEDRTAFITSIDGFDSEWIQLDDSFIPEYLELSFENIVLDTAEIRQIVDRSIRNQIENAYFEVKSDSIIPMDSYPEEFGRFETFYVLDDFNRFPTIRDSFVEYIPTVTARRRGAKYEFKIIPKFYLPTSELSSIAFLDGLPVTADEILTFSPYRIESIGIINNRYFMGPTIFDGIISFRTKQGDLHGFVPGLQSRELYYTGVSPEKIYIFPVYGESSLAEADLSSRIPDFRDQLYWNPEVRISSEDGGKIEFFTSDTIGEFEVIIEGLTDLGEPISIRSYFMVE